MKLIVGLGNPGGEYESTRHNTGYILLDFLAGKKIEWKKSSGTEALFHKDKIGKKTVEYLKPTTYMNNSGVAVRHVVDKHKLKIPADVVVIYDDVDLPLGKIKISINKNSGGHNGLESIIKKLKTKEFVRIRIGVSKSTPTGKIRKAKGEEKMLKFLLGNFKDDEIKELKKVSKRVGQALETLFEEGLGKAMSLYNN